MHLLMFNKDRSHYIAALSYTNQQGHPMESHYASLHTIHPSFPWGLPCLFTLQCMLGQSSSFKNIAKIEQQKP